MTIYCPKAYFDVDTSLEKPDLPRIPNPEKITPTLEYPKLDYRSDVSKVSIKIDKPDLDVDIEKYRIADRYVSLLRPDRVDIPVYQPPSTPSAPSDIEDPLPVTQVPFSIDVKDISAEFRDILVDLDIDLDPPELTSIDLPEPIDITVGVPFGIPILPIIEVSLIITELPPEYLEVVLGRPVFVHRKLFSIVDDSAYSYMLSKRFRLISFFEEIFDSINLDLTTLGIYYQNFLNLLNTAYQKSIAIRNKANEIEYWINHFKLQESVFANYYKQAVAIYNSKLRIAKDNISLVREYYNGLQEVYRTANVVSGEYSRMARSAIADAENLINRVSSLNNDIYSAYRQHVELSIRLLQRDRLIAEKYALQAEKTSLLYRLLELNSLGELADAQRKALQARYNAIMERFYALEEESRVLSSIISAANMKLEAVYNNLIGSKMVLKSNLDRLNLMPYAADKLYYEYVMKDLGIYREKISSFLSKVREFYDITSKIDLANIGALKDRDLTKELSESEITNVHDELAADIRRAKLHEVGLNQATEIMSKARIASTIIESYR